MALHTMAVYFYDIFQNNFRFRNVSDKVVEKNQSMHFVLNFSPN
jgi:hypothetical protein